MISSLGVNFSFNKDLMEERYIIRRLMALGIPSTGDIASDKALLKKVEAGLIKPVDEIHNTKAENIADNIDTKQNSIQALESEKIGAEQLGILNKLKLGLI